MGIAYSPPDRVVHVEFPADTSECIRNALHTAVQKAGWEIFEEIENGWVYLLTSPQDPVLQCKVKIQDTGRFSFIYSGAPLVDLTWMSVDETMVSPPFGLKWGTTYSDEPPPRMLRAHITPCQIFTYRKGGVGGPGNLVMGGIPFIDPNALSGDHCADEDNELKTLRAFWAGGDVENIFNAYGTSTFRAGWTCHFFATLHNDDLVSVTTPELFYMDPLLRLVPYNRATHFWEAYANINDDYPVIIRWMGTEEPLCFDPFIAWNSAHPVKIRGQLWDAFVRTQYVPWEDPLAFESYAWFSYSNGERQGSPTPHIYSTGDLYTLYLRDPGLIHLGCEGTPEPEVGGSNYVY